MQHDYRDKAVDSVVSEYRVSAEKLNKICDFIERTFEYFPSDRRDYDEASVHF